MADSDDESERRRSRDKFRRERSEYEGRRRPADKREPFDDRPATVSVGYGRLDYMSGDSKQSSLDQKRSPTGEPPFKRARKEQVDDYRSMSKRRDIKTNIVDSEIIYRPPVIPFKRFLDSLDDLVSEDEACDKYREYKVGYMKKHIEEFFEAHKQEEWLRMRYHPDHMESRKETIAAAVKHRLNIFMELLGKGFFQDQSVQMDNSENLIKLMDAVVIKLEGGSDDDLKILEESDRGRFSDNETERQRPQTSQHEVGDKNNGEPESDGEIDSDKDLNAFSTGKKLHSQKRPTHDTFEKLVRKRTTSSDADHSPQSGTSSSSNSDSDSDSEDAGGITNKGNAPVPDDVKDHKNGMANSDLLREIDDDDDDVPTPTTAEAPTGGCADESTLPPTVSTILLGSTLSSMSQQQPPFNDSEEKTKETTSAPKVPRPLHKTSSIFFRALPPTIKEAELRELCASQPGFIRLALWEPAPERRFMRHAWATYNHSVNIKKVCWALNTSPMLREKLDLPNGELGATVNRDLAQRVRPLTPLTRHKPIMRQDLLLAAQLVARLDLKHNLWQSASKSSAKLEEEQLKQDLESNDKCVLEKPEITGIELAIQSVNPLLKNLTDYLVDERGSEEEALIAETNQTDAENPDNSTNRGNSIALESDPNLAEALDLLILYLRIVHSVDYYAGAIYSMEDLMPHRCGILHARGDRGLNSTVSGGRQNGLTFTQREVDEHMQSFAQKVRPHIDVPKTLSEEEMKKLGMRDPEKAAEDFIESNIQKRTSKKKPFKVVWVCPLSDKKFREPIFVRKHIFNKHMEKIEAAKKDNAIFFNNYLRDPNRPSLPEAPYHLINQYYPPTNSGGNHPYRGRGSGRGYRGGYRPNNTNSLLSRNSATFQDYYDVATQQQQHQAMAAVAAAAAAAFYPNATAADLYALAAAGAPRGGMSGARRGRGSPQQHEYGSRSYGLNDNRRRQPTGYSGMRRVYGSGERRMVSYNDLDDPNNDNI